MLYISAGQRGEELCLDSWTIGPVPLELGFPVDLLSLASLCVSVSAHVPSGFTQRAMIDTSTGQEEIIVWNGMAEAPDGEGEMMQVSLGKFTQRGLEWQMIPPTPYSQEPMTRFGGQVSLFHTGAKWGCCTHSRVSDCGRSRSGSVLYARR